MDQIQRSLLISDLLDVVSQHTDVLIQYKSLVSDVCTGLPSSVIMTMTRVDLHPERSTYVWRLHCVNNDDDKCGFTSRTVNICLETTLC